MYNIYDSLTEFSDIQGIKDINVLYDTLFINFKVNDPDTSENFDYVLIQKLKFDYDTNVISSASDALINFGDTGNTLPLSSTTGNQFVDWVLLEKPKTVFVCGVSSISGSFIPTIYNYDINNASLKKLYPASQNDVDNWSTFVGGSLSGSTPKVAYNPDIKILNFMFQTVNNAVHQLNDIEFYYNENQITLNDVHTLSGDAILNYPILKFKNYNDNEKLLLFTKNQQIVPVTIDYT